MKGDTRSLSVVLPIYNEGSHLNESVELIMTFLKTLSLDQEIVLVDDGSKDNSWEVIEQLGRRNANIIGVKLSRNFGKERAVIAGIEAASKELTIVMDGDLQHPMELIPLMIDKISTSQVNLVQARKVRRQKESLVYRMFAQAFYMIVSNLTQLDLRGSSDFVLFDGQVKAALLSVNERNIFFRGLATWVGFKRAEIEMHVGQRVGGTSQWTTRKLLQLAITAITSFSAAPLRLISIFGWMFTLGFLGLSLQTLYKKFTGQAVAGFTTVILLQLIIASIVLLGIGVVGEYIAQIYEEVKQRPRFIVSKKINQKTEDLNPQLCK